MKRIERIKRNLWKANYLWNEISYLVENLQSKDQLIGLKRFCKKVKVSKNTGRKYIRFALGSKINFFKYIVIPSSKGNDYPLELASMIAIDYAKACKERENITKGKKTRITFDTFIHMYNQNYIIDGFTYKPKRSYIMDSIKFHGLYSQLSTHKTKQSARFKKTHIEQIAKEYEYLFQKIGLNQELKIIQKDLKEAIKNAPKMVYTYKPGQRIEIDASKEMWGSEEWTLYTAIDSSTGFKVAEHIEREETNLGYIRLLRKMLEKYGKPQQIITDKRRGWDGMGVAQLRETLESIGIEVISTSDPNAKAKVERSFRTMENDFYYNYLRINNILTFKDAKKFVNDCTDEYNKKYKKELDYEESLYLSMTDSDWNSLEIKYILLPSLSQSPNSLPMK